MWLDGSVRAHGDQRYLLQIRVVPLIVGFTVARGKLPKRGLRRQGFAKILFVDVRKLSSIRQIVQVNRGIDRVIELHTRFFQIIEKIAHRLPSLIRGGFGVDATVWSRNKSALRGTIERVAGEDTRAGRRTRRHILWTDCLPPALAAT